MTTLLLMAISCGTALGVIMTRNPIYAVLLLVGLFAETAILFLLYGAEFYAVLLLTVYIGAIAILFLFVIMMLNLRIVELYGSVFYHLPIGAFLGLLLLVVLGFLLSSQLFDLLYINGRVIENVASIEHGATDKLYYESNMKAIGQLLYNSYLEYFVIISLVLLVAMIGVIIITVEYQHKLTTRRIIEKETKRVSKENIV